MTRVVQVPARFDDRTFDQFALAIGEPGDERMLFDAHGAQWGSPYALVGALAVGQWMHEQKLERPFFTVPGDPEVAHYWARAGFFRHAAEFFELHGKIPRTPTGSTDVLLDVTPVRGSDDVHLVVDRIQDRSHAILTELGLGAEASMGFAMALSEACQNIVEHAGTGGWVAVQVYTWRRRLRRRVVMIAVADGGIGFRASLESTQAKRMGDRWNDKAALEAAVFQGVSRMRDPGRGHGLAGIRRYTERWNGKLAIRSGTARLSIVPDWDDDVPIAEGLPRFPGSQVLIIIPGTDTSP
jgi:anti-sigma regulatory factor (Ser/Thr protein kinase)